MKPWLDNTVDDKFAIEHIPCPHPGPVDLNKPPAGVMHTTEGTNWDSLVAEFKQHDTPTFMVAPHRIAQLVPLGSMAAALEHPPGTAPTNGWARVQIEVLAFSKESPYSFDAATSDTLASLLATLTVKCGIPLTRPFPDAMPPKPWAIQTFARRKAGKWGTTAGWFGHIEIPSNSHWDPGALRWSDLLAEAKKRIPLRAKLKPYYVVRVIQGRLRRV